MEWDNGDGNERARQEELRRMKAEEVGVADESR
jgi:hypothetical protein